MPNNSGENYIIEYFKIGAYIKVSAIDPVSGREVCVMVPSHGVSEKQMQELAIRKLKYVLNKEDIQS